jgi:hypothetical protein
MNDSKPKIALADIGILSKLTIKHYFKVGYRIEVSHIPEDKRPLSVMEKSD